MTTIVCTENPPTRKHYESIIPGLIAKHALTMIASEPGIGKSHLMVDISATVAQKMPVLIIVPEAEDEFWENLDIWRDFYKLTTPNLHVFLEPLNLREATVVTWLIAQMQKMQAVLLCIDGLSLCMGDKTDSDTEAMAATCNSISKIIRTTSCGALANHHTGWNTKRERGGNRLRQTSRVVGLLSKAGTGIILKCDKSNRKRFDDLVLQFEPHGVGAVLTPMNNAAFSPILSDTQQSIIDTLRLEAVPSPTSVHQLAEASNIPKTTLYRTMGSLKADGYLDEEMVRGCRKYFLTDMGHAAASVTESGQPIDANLNKPKGALLWDVTFPRQREKQPSIPTTFPRSTASEAASIPTDKASKAGQLTTDSHLIPA